MSDINYKTNYIYNKQIVIIQLFIINYQIIINSV